MVQRRSEKTRDDLTLLPSDSQVVVACKRLMGRIYDKALAKGDQLDTQEVLCQTLNMGGGTISAAMRSLVDAGVLTRRRRVGTLLADVRAWVPGLWTVGVASFLIQGQGSGSFFADLSHRLQGHLRFRACRVQSYMLAVQAGEDPPAIVHFEEALRDLESDRIDVLLTPTYVPTNIDRYRPSLRNKRIIHVGFQESAKVAVVIDEARFAREATAALVARGCKKLGLVTSSPAEKTNDTTFGTGFTHGMQEAGLAGSGRFLHGGFGLPGGRVVAEQLLAMAPTERPDGLVVTDDWIAMGLASTLRSNEGYRPLIVVQTNLQTPLAFALPVIRFTVDIDELALRAVEMVVDRLTSANGERQVAHVPARRVDDSAAEMPPEV
jgi:DNA-binding LacI/PurR family transcriptional regulator